MTAPERFADSQIPLAPRAPSIHDPSRRSAERLLCNATVSPPGSTGAFRIAFYKGGAFRRNAGLWGKPAIELPRSEFLFAFNSEALHRSDPIRLHF